MPKPDKSNQVFVIPAEWFLGLVGALHLWLLSRVLLLLDAGLIPLVEASPWRQPVAIVLVLLVGSMAYLLYFNVAHLLQLLLLTEQPAAGFRKGLVNRTMLLLILVLMFSLVRSSLIL